MGPENKKFWKSVLICQKLIIMSDIASIHHISTPAGAGDKALPWVDELSALSKKHKY